MGDKTEPELALTQEDVERIGALLWAANEAGAFPEFDQFINFNNTMAVFSAFLIHECGVNPEDYRDAE